jgi:putative heme transporter
VVDARGWLATATVRIGRGVVAVAVLATMALSLRWLPRSAGSSWTDVAGLIHEVRPAWILALAVVWLAGLVAHTPVLTASLPGLSVRRALALNFAGSAIGNTVPLGGAVSVGLTSAMVRSWGFTRVRIGAFLVVSAIWNMLVRLLVGILGLLWLVLTQSGSGWRTGAVMASVSGTVVVAVGALLLSDRACARTGMLLGHLIELARSVRLNGRREAERTRPTVRLGESLGLALLRLRRQILRILATSWLQMTGGMLGYLLLLAVLLEGSLRAVGTTASASLVLAAVAIERLLTSIPFTPGGAGVAELGLTACLTLSGVDPVLAITAALIYRAFTFLLEIPVGLLVASGWAVGRRRHAQAERLITA